jgi:hypothetical protein
VADSWCWFVVREKYCWLVARGWFVLREKYCWLVADKPSEQGEDILQGCIYHIIYICVFFFLNLDDFFLWFARILTKVMVSTRYVSYIKIIYILCNARVFSSKQITY